MNKQPWFLIVTLVLIAAVTVGCGGTAAAPTETPAPTELPAASPTATQLALAPTLADGEANDTDGGAVSATPRPPTETPPPAAADTTATATRQGPTPLPEPTQIQAATPTPAGDAAGDDDQPAPNTGSSGPGIVMNPQIGEPRDVVVVTGTGFEPNETVTLHWGAVGGDTGPVYHEVTANADGRFEVGLIVLPADRWPGGAPEERDLLQLRARAESLDENYYFANFTYIPRTTTTSALVLTYTNTEYGYTISVPNGWTWTWEEDDLTDVRFASPGGTGKGFVRVEGSNQQQAVQTVMSQEFPGQGYTTGTMSVGSYPGTEVTADNGRVVQFITANGRTYALSFVNDSGSFATNIHDSFTLQ